MHNYNFPLDPNTYKYMEVLAYYTGSYLQSIYLIYNGRLLYHNLYNIEPFVNILYMRPRYFYRINNIYRRVLP